MICVSVGWVHEMQVYAELISSPSIETAFYHGELTNRLRYLISLPIKGCTRQKEPNTP